MKTIGARRRRMLAGERELVRLTLFTSNGSTWGVSATDVRRTWRTVTERELSWRMALAVLRDLYGVELVDVSSRILRADDALRYSVRMPQRERDELAFIDSGRA